MPTSEEEKFALYTNFMKCTSSVLQDMSIYVLMILLVAFDGAPEGSVPVRLRSNFHAMMVRYLTEKKGVNADEEVAKIYETIALLPELARPFQEMKYYSEILKSTTQI